LATDEVLGNVKIAKSKRPVDPLGAFFVHYREFERGSGERGRLAFTRRFASICRSFERSANQSRTQARRTGSFFNPLLLLRLQEVERVHTTLLAELFDPLGSHSQGYLFLKAFLLRVGHKRVAELLKDRSSEIWVDEEVGTHLGRPDIFISVPPYFAAIIENKVKADEGIDQLLRYRKLLDLQPVQETSLIYLTPDGRRSKTGVKKYRRASYKKHVRESLQDCLPFIQAARVRDWVEQYLLVVEAITNEK
jgi:hypothetical protein